MNSMRYTKHELAFAILRTYSAAKPRSLHKYNALGGRGGYSGDFEHELNTTFSREERALAGRVLDELQGRGQLEPTYEDMIEPGNWLRITTLGEQALQTGALDELDNLLLDLHSSDDLLSLRYGAYEAIVGQNTDWQRHAGTSCRKLITKVLHTIASDDAVRADPQFSSDPTSSNGITRRHRIKYYLRQRSGRSSNSDTAVAEKACELIEACNTRLSAATHANVTEAESLVKLTKNALYFLLHR